METIVELTPVQSMLMYRAWYPEQSRIRHEKEFWISQASRDEGNREMLMKQAIELGVPETQVDRFVYWKDTA